jgi:hypothetical protein
MRLGRRLAAVTTFCLLGSTLAQLPLRAETPAMSYGQLREALMRGELPAFVIDFNKCRDGAGTAGPPLTALPAFRVYNLTNNFIATSTTHLFEAKDGAMTLEYVRGRFYPGDAVEFTLKRLDPASYKPMVPATTYRCSLRDGSVRVKAQGLAEIFPLRWDDKAPPSGGQPVLGKTRRSRRSPTSARIASARTFKPARSSGCQVSDP